MAVYANKEVDNDEVADKNHSRVYSVRQTPATCYLWKEPTQHRDNSSDLMCEEGKGEKKGKIKEEITWKETKEKDH
ncbi:hypothetical protein TNCV_2362861 [Trichonephila clavipes]|nr:hypothetical protein TNCV_2362861 [Trichonephila clavipes]